MESGHLPEAPENNLARTEQLVDVVGLELQRLARLQRVLGVVLDTVRANGAV